MSRKSISMEQILAYAAGELADTDDRQRVKAHLQRDAEAAAIVRQYRAVQQAVAADDSIDPSAALVARARQLFRPVTRTTESWLDCAAAVVARLIFDSRAETVAVRSSAVAERVQLAYDWDNADIDLIAEMTSGANEQPVWRVTAEVTSDESNYRGRYAIVDAQRQTTVASGPLNADCPIFHAELEPGQYEIHLELNGVHVVAPNVDLN